MWFGEDRIGLREELTCRLWQQGSQPNLQGAPEGGWPFRVVPYWGIGTRPLYPFIKPVIGRSWSPSRDHHPGWGASLHLKVVPRGELIRELPAHRILSSWNMSVSVPKRGTGQSTVRCSMAHPLCCSNPLLFYSILTLSGNICCILVGLVSSELKNEGLVGNPTALTSTVISRL